MSTATAAKTNGRDARKQRLTQIHEVLVRSTLFTDRAGRLFLADGDDPADAKAASRNEVLRWLADGAEADLEKHDEISVDVLRAIASAQ